MLKMNLRPGNTAQSFKRFQNRALCVRFVFNNSPGVILPSSSCIIFLQILLPEK